MIKLIFIINKEISQIIFYISLYSSDYIIYLHSINVCKYPSTSNLLRFYSTKFSLNIFLIKITFRQSLLFLYLFIYKVKLRSGLSYILVENRYKIFPEFTGFFHKLLLTQATFRKQCSCFDTPTGRVLDQTRSLSCAAFSTSMLQISVSIS